MPLKLINATELRVGTFILIDNSPCVVKSMDVSKTGKHGHAKVRLEAVGVIDGKKRVMVMPGSERLSVPLIEKRKAQVLSVNKQEKKANIMDLESFETLVVQISNDLIEDIQEGSQVEYWDIENQKIIKRLI